MTHEPADPAERGGDLDDATRAALGKLSEALEVVEEYDDGYYALFRALESTARHDLAGGRRHVFEAWMKEDRRTHGARHHESHPGASAG